jgi:hypothetical protein
MGFFDFFFRKQAHSAPVQHIMPDPPAARVLTERIVTRAELAHLPDDINVAVEQTGNDGRLAYTIGKPSVLREVLGDIPVRSGRRRRKQPRRVRSHDFMGVAGESYRQSALSSLISAGGPFLATLIPEPTNPHDNNAVKVLVNGRHVGYLKRETASQFGRAIAAERAPVQCPATLHPPQPPNTNIAVTLDFSRVYALVESDDYENDGGTEDNDEDEKCDFDDEERDS